MSLQVFDLRVSHINLFDIEGKAERERYEQAYELIRTMIIYDADCRKPGDFIRRWGYRFSRLKELKSHHFNLLPTYKICK